MSGLNGKSEVAFTADTRKITTSLPRRHNWRRTRHSTPRHDRNITRQRMVKSADALSITLQANIAQGLGLPALPMGWPFLPFHRLAISPLRFWQAPITNRLTNTSFQESMPPLSPDMLYRRMPSSASCRAQTMRHGRLLTTILVVLRSLSCILSLAVSVRSILLILSNLLPLTRDMDQTLLISKSSWKPFCSIVGSWRHLQWSSYSQLNSYRQ